MVRVVKSTSLSIATQILPGFGYPKTGPLGPGESGKAYSLRYIGSMAPRLSCAPESFLQKGDILVTALFKVGDIHRTLLYGGIFAYPADNKNQASGASCLQS